MEIDLNELSPSKRYALMIRAITPRPIAWISTVSPSGIVNLAPFSFFAGVGSNPPAIVVSIADKPDGSPKDTLRNIESSGEFVVNMVPYGVRDAMYLTSKEFDFDVSEVEQAGLKCVASKTIAPPRIVESPIQLECKLHQIVRVGSSATVFGIIQWASVDDSVLDDEQKIDPATADLIGRMGGMGYCRTTDRFELK
ncbi:MAG: flavin reductase family protein [Pirellulaceae bacterium]